MCRSSKPVCFWLTNYNYIATTTNQPMDFGRFFNFGSRRCKFAARRHFVHHFGKHTVFCTVLLTCCIAHFIILLSYSVIMKSVRNIPACMFRVLIILLGLFRCYGKFTKLSTVCGKASNQIFHYFRHTVLRRGCNQLVGPSSNSCGGATQLLSKKCRSGSDPLATLCPIWPTWDLNLRPPFAKTNALQLD